MGSIRECPRKDGTCTYHAEVRMKEHSQRATFRTRSLAKKWIQDVESAIRDGRHFKTAESKRHTVGEMIDRFITQWLSKHPQRQKKQSSYLQWWKQYCGDLTLSKLSPAVIAEARDQLLTETTVRGGLRSSSTVNRYLSAFGKALTVAVKEWGWLEDSPMRNVTKPPEGRGRERFLTISEKNRLLEACRESRNLNLLPIVSLAIITAMRLGEITGLRWTDIDFERRTATLWCTKNGDKRVVPLTMEAVAIFKSCPTYGGATEERVFQSKRNGRTEKRISIREAFENALRKAEIKDFRFHDLRHTAASYMAMGGATQGELMAILGHRSPAMTRRYAHYSQDHLNNVVEKAWKVMDIKEGA